MLVWYSNDAQPPGLSMEVGDGRTVLFDVDDLGDGVLLCLLIPEHHFPRAVVLQLADGFHLPKTDGSFQHGQHIRAFVHPACSVKVNESR